MMTLQQPANSYNPPRRRPPCASRAKPLDPTTNRGVENSSAPRVDGVPRDALHCPPVTCDGKRKAHRIEVGSGSHKVGQSP